MTKTIILLHSFRFLLSQESNKPNWHRSLVAIKEHGILISIEDPEHSSNDPVEFWVIGLVFHSSSESFELFD